MSSNEQQNYEQAGGSFKFDPFSSFMCGQPNDKRTFEEILKEFEQFTEFDGDH